MRSVYQIWAWIHGLKFGDVLEDLAKQWKMDSLVKPSSWVETCEYVLPIIF